jgi:hypothetical protein
MPTEIRNVEPKFYSQSINGDNYLLNNTDFLSYLGGGTTEKLKVVSTIQVGTEFELSNWRFLEITTDSRYVIIQNGANFTNDFYVGATIQITQGNQTSTIFTIESVTNDEIYVEYVSGATITPNDATGTSKNTNGSFALLSNISPITGLEYKYGIIENSESFSVVSPLTNTEQVFKVSNIDTTVTGTVHNGVSIGKNKAWVTGNITCEFKGNVTNKNVYSQSDTWKEYEITHEFINNTYWESGEDDDIDGDGLPERFEGIESVKYVFETGFFNDPNNPNTAVRAEFDTSDGAVGYFDESFNGEVNKYSISDLVITDNTEGGDSTVTFSINDSSSSMSVAQNVVVGHSYRPEADIYSYSTDEFKDVWLYDSVWQAGGQPFVDGTIITNYTVTYVSTSKVDISFDISFTVDQQNKIREGYKYSLWAITQDWSGATTATGGKATISVQNSTYNKNSDIPDLYGVDRQEYIPHSLDWVDSTTTTGFTNAFMDVEEGMMSFVRFWIDTTKGALLESLTFILGTIDNDTNEVGELRKVEFDLTDQVFANSIQYITQDGTRGYILPEGDQFNWIKLNTVDKIGDKQYYEALIGWKAPWQEWLEYNDADPDAFYDPNESLNGLNQFSQRYSTSTEATSNNFTVNVVFDAVMSLGGINTLYRNTGGDVDIYGYDEDETGLASYTCSLNTYGDPADGSPVYANNLIKDGYTELRGVLTPSSPPTFSQSVDFTDVSSNWSRFAHGNKRTVGLLRLNGDPQLDVAGTWDDEQAGEILGIKDTFRQTALIIFDKDDPLLYTSTTTSITTQQNLGALYGLYSPDELEYYGIEGEMFSAATDDDVISYVIAWNIDDFGVEHTLTLCATTGGVLLDANPAYIVGDPTTDSFLAGLSNNVNWAIVYDFGKSGAKQIASYTSSQATLNWGSLDQNTQTFEFSIDRNGKDITVDCEWNLPSGLESNTFNIDLTTDTDLEKFLGASSIGFCFFSQDQGGFKNVILTKPDADFYGILRLDPENSSVDGSITESSTLRGSKSNSLLSPSVLNWNGTSFIISATIDTDLIEEGETYKQSVEIRSKNIITP